MKIDVMLSVNRMGDLVGNITNELDNFNIYKNELDKCYFMTHSTGVLVFRTPGSSKGCLKYDENMQITSITIYDDAYDKSIGCFNIRDKDKIEHSLSKYIGGKLILWI